MNNIFYLKFTIWTFAYKDFKARYKGTLLGVVWSILQPLIILGLYWIIFSLIFQPRWQHLYEANSAIILFSGLIIHIFFSQVLSLSTVILRRNEAFIKKVKFPVEILPVTAVISASIQLLISYSLLILILGLFESIELVSIILGLIILLPLIFMSIGIAWLFAVFSVFVRDLSEISGLISTVLLFTSGILIPLNLVSTNYLYLLYLNPLTIIVEEFRSVLLNNSTPDIYSLLLYCIVSFIVMFIGLYIFSRSKKIFPDVI